MHHDCPNGCGCLRREPLGDGGQGRGPQGAAAQYFPRRAGGRVPLHHRRVRLRQEHAAANAWPAFSRSPRGAFCWRAIRSKPCAQQLPLAVGYLPQFGAFHGDLTVAEILDFAVALRLPSLRARGDARPMERARHRPRPHPPVPAPKIPHAFRRPDAPHRPGGGTHRRSRVSLSRRADQRPRSLFRARADGLAEGPRARLATRPSCWSPTR